MQPTSEDRQNTQVSNFDSSNLPYVSRAAVTQVKQRAPAFDPCAYNYEQHIDEFNKLERLFNLPVGHLEQLRITQGGKPVGFEIAKQLAVVDERLRLPEILPDLPKNQWEVYSTYEELRRSNESISGLILRTSDPDEDWIDPRCGVGHSPQIDFSRMGISSAKWFYKLLEEKLATQKKFVPQALYDGIGYVADVAYSAVLERPVIHIACGRRYKNCYTSATEDPSSSHYIFDLETGTQLLPDLDKQQQPLLYQANDTITELVGMLQKMSQQGINFGFQIELRIDPYQPEQWWLLQFRPSPDRLRMENTFNFPDAAPMLFSAKTSGYGQYKATTYVPEFSLHIGPSEVEALCEKAGKRYGKIDSDLSFKDNTVLWQKPSVYSSIKLYTFLGAALLGAKLQIVNGTCFTAVQHGEFVGLEDFEKEHMQTAIEQCLFVALTSSEFEKLNGRLSNRPRPSYDVEVISDGLVAAIYKYD